LLDFLHSNSELHRPCKFYSRLHTEHWLYTDAGVATEISGKFISQLERIPMFQDRWWTLITAVTHGNGNAWAGLNFHVIWASANELEHHNLKIEAALTITINSLKRTISGSDLQHWTVPFSWIRHVVGVSGQHHAPAWEKSPGHTLERRLDGPHSRSLRYREV
jgi:hypothetical protein